MGEDVVKPGTQCGCQCLAEGRGLGFGRQSPQSLQHGLQHSVYHHPCILTRSTGMFWGERRERTDCENMEIQWPQREEQKRTRMGTVMQSHNWEDLDHLHTENPWKERWK